MSEKKVCKGILIESDGKVQLLVVNRHAELIVPVQDELFTLSLCPEYLVESMDRTGRPVEQWVDEQRLVEA